jgi:hypothetical protein
MADADQLASLEAEVSSRRQAVESARLPLPGNDVVVLYRAACDALRRAQPASPLSMAGGL